MHMLRAAIRTTSARSIMASSTRSASGAVSYNPGPVEASMHEKLTETFKPALLRIANDSSKHAHHSAMRAQGGGNGETHFAVQMVSNAFQGKPQIARHRLVNTALKEEFDVKGLHALSLRLKTPAEWEKEGGTLDA